MKEKLIPFEYANNYRNIAKSQTRNIDMNDLCYGATYVPAKIAIQMQQTDHIVPVVWDGSSNEEENKTENIICTLYMTPQYPAILYPLQKYDDHGAIPYMIPLFSSSNKNTFMLWMLCGMLTRIEEIWKLTSNTKLYQSKWHGWVLTYLSSKCFTHINTQVKKRNRFQLGF